MGDRNNFNRQIGELASYNNEIVMVVPLKAEGAPVPGAGFSPEAVARQLGGNEEHQNGQPLPRESMKISILKQAELVS
jgi:hypothetical protein